MKSQATYWGDHWLVQVFWFFMTIVISCGTVAVIGFVAHVWWWLLTIGWRFLG